MNRLVLVAILTIVSSVCYAQFAPYGHQCGFVDSVGAPDETDALRGAVAIIFCGVSNDSIQNGSVVWNTWGSLNQWGDTLNPYEPRLFWVQGGVWVLVRPRDRLIPSWAVSTPQNQNSGICDPNYAGGIANYWNYQTGGRVQLQTACLNDTLPGQAVYFVNDSGIVNMPYNQNRYPSMGNWNGSGYAPYANYF